MSDFKNEIKSWLKRLGKDRYWLAKRTYATKATVDGWLASRGEIPLAKRDLIRSLMKENDKTIEGIRKDRDLWKALALVLSNEEFEMVEKAAMREGMSLQNWSEQILVRAAKKKLVGDTMKKKMVALKAAEEAAAYGSPKGHNPLSADI